ncbi:transposase family protein, partial [Streptomyces sp. NPDC002838]|uniref:transposase family protein n=1 Tax=Streptomyces sp. NPDC002838 TaxID=3154436 RepID=UPI00331D5240
MDGHELSWQDVLFAGIAVFAEATVCDTGAVIVRAHGRAREGNCLSCGRPSSRVHDRYRRQLQDVPLAARPVRIVLEVRRFVCVNTECGQRTFAEQIPGFTSPFARCTDRLGALLNVIALALAGRAGARMAMALGITAGRMGLLNRVRAMPDPSYGTPRVLGVDDFAIKRGHT